MNKAFEIVFEDEYLVVVNKIAKILVQPIDRTNKINLTSFISKVLGQKVYPCHRLDKETSGLIIYAKDLKTQKDIGRQFRTGSIKKKYFAFVKGAPQPRKGILEGEIIDREAKIYKEKPKQAKTIYRTIKAFRNFSFLELKPLTGRTNQLRIQLAQIGNPILGERKYAFGKDFAVKFRRLALQACYLEFVHPLSRDKICLKLDLAKDMAEFLKTVYN